MLIQSCLDKEDIQLGPIEETEIDCIAIIDYSLIILLQSQQKFYHNLPAKKKILELFASNYHFEFFIYPVHWGVLVNAIPCKVDREILIIYFKTHSSNLTPVF